jgi:methanogenic corrinoid protein MtbC1
VRQTGVPAPTLRAWERRYGVLAPRRGDNAYRLYSEQDIAMVAWLREQIQAGMTISQAIALLKSLEVTRRRGRRTARGAPPQGNGHPAGSAASSLARSPLPAVPDCFAFDELQAALLHQLTRLDEAGADRTVAQALTVHSVEQVCLHVLAPVLRDIGRQWSEGALGVTVEHFSAALVRAQLESLFRATSSAESGPLVLVGCAPGEAHEIGPLMLALFLRRAGLRTAYLGQSVEPESLLATARSVRPAAVLLSASTATAAETLVDVGRRLAATNDRRLAFGFGGQAFATAPELATPIAGAFLGADAQQAARDVHRRLLS